MLLVLFNYVAYMYLTSIESNNVEDPVDKAVMLVWCYVNKNYLEKTMMFKLLSFLLFSLLLCRSVEMKVATKVSSLVLC